MSKITSFICLKFFLFIVLVMSAISAGAVELEFAYNRSMLGVNTEKGSSACFKLAGAAAKYRMGNECEIYTELLFGQQINQFSDGSVLKAHVMGSNYIPLADHKMQTNNQVDFRFAQFYLGWDKIAALNNANVWAGRRYYKREDVHITDFFYWNPQGLGAGIENIELGEHLKLSYAMFVDDNEDQIYNTKRHDIQLRGIDVNPNGQLEFGVSVIPKSDHTTTGSDGWAAILQHRQSKIITDTGLNKLAVQYGVGPGTGLGGTGSIDNNSNVTRLRIVEGLVAQVTPQWGGMVTAVYQKDSSESGNQTWTSLGGRVSYGVSQHFKMQAEFGQDWVSPDGQDTRRLSKLTIAPTWSFKSTNFMARPELRFFYTQAAWNTAASEAAYGSMDAAVASLSSTGVFGNAHHGGTIGVQFEGWWP